MTYGIIAAMQMEAERIIAALSDVTRETVGGVEYTIGTVGQNRVICAVCGIGKVFAALCAQAMIVKYAPDCLINTGVAGTLTHALTVGDAAVSTAVVQHDLDTSPLGDPVGMISGINKIELEADPALCKRVMNAAEAMGLHAVSGVIASGDQFIADRAVKERIVSRFHAIACEMEGAAIGQVCHVNGVPFVVVRAISDDADGGACEDYPAFARESAARSAELVVKLLRA